jgi:hypothetical protein
VIGALLAIMLALAGPQEAARPPEPQAGADTAAHEGELDAGLKSDLAALSPEAPRNYFLLAERIADLAGERADDSLRRLARHLAVLSYELTKRSGAIGGVADDSARSVCLLLASIAPSPQEARWLRALAGTFDRDVLGGVYEPPGTGPTRDEATLDAATVLGLVRSGQGRRAEKLLHKPGVAELLQRHERLLSPAGFPGEFDRLKRTMADWPTCPQCHGKRYITKIDNNGRLAGVFLCDTCGGLPGPKTPLTELVLQLRLEALLLAGVQKSWSGQILIDGGAPLRELDADELAARLGIDADKPLWRNGDWVEDPGRPRPRPPSVAPAPAAHLPAGETPGEQR